MNEFNNFDGFSDLSLAALHNDDMFEFFRENRIILRSTKGKKENVSLYTIEEYCSIREDFLKWIVDKNGN